MNTNQSAPDSHSHPTADPSELRIEAEQMPIYQSERLAFTDAATSAASPPSVSRRRRAWLEAMKYWVLSR